MKFTEWKISHSTTWGDVESLWKNLLDSFGQDGVAFVPHHDPEVKTPPRLLIFAEKGSRRPILGPAMKMAILTALAESREIGGQKGFSINFLSQKFGEPYGTDFGNSPPSAIARPKFMSNPDRWVRTWARDYPSAPLHAKVLPLMELFLRLVNADFRKGRPPLTIEDLWQSRFEGPEAVAKFVDFVTGAARRQQPFRARSSFFSLDGGNRRGTLGHMIDWAGKDADNQGHQPMIQNIHARGMRVDLSAFGDRLLQELKTNLPDGPEALYLPLLPFAKARSGKLPHQFGLVEFTGLLEYFYTHPEPAVDDLEAIPSHHTFDTSLVNIRTAMIQRPRVLIIDGVNVVSADNPRHQLERFVDGNSVLGVLSRIAEAPLGRLESEADLQAFARNRILILSDDPIVPPDVAPEADPSMPFLTARPGKTFVPIPLAMPAEADGEKIIANHGFDHEEQILALRATSPTLYQKLRDLEYFALEAYFGLEAHARDSGRAARERLARDLTGDLGEGGHIHVILDAAQSVIAPERRLLRGLLFLLTLSPDGLREDTLVRVAEYHLYIERTGDPAAAGMELGVCYGDVAGYRQELGKLCEDLSDSEILKRALEDLLQAMPTVLHRTSGDYVPGLDSGAEGLEVFENEGTWRRGLGSSSSESVGFTMPEYRHALQEILVDWFGEDAYRIACRILSLEALRQQAMVFRHEGIPEGQMLRPWRRQVTAILLGLQSLPVVEDAAPRESEKTPRVRIDDRYDDLFHNVSIQYRTSERFYTWLYFFAYRQQIERPPAQNLSRLYGLNRFKSRLLGAFERPWQLTSDFFPKDPAFDERNLFEDVHGEGGAQYEKALRKDAVIQHLLARIVADTATGNEGGARSALDALRRLPMAPGDRHEGFKLRMAAMRRQIDVGILGQDDTSEILRHLKRWAVEDEDAGQSAGGGRRTGRRRPGSLDELMEWPPQLMGRQAFRALNGLICRISIMFYEHLTDPANTPFDRRTLVRMLDLAESRILGRLSGPWAEFLRGEDGLSDLSDLLYRVAEMINLGAENARRPDMSSHGAPETASVKDFSLGKMFKSAPSSYWSIMRRHCCALAIFQVAEKLRLLVFERAPTSRNFFASGHSMREMILLACFLENERQLLLSRSAMAEPVSETDQIFVRIARDGSLALSRHLFRYPGERGSMMLMEAAILRMVARMPAADAALDSEAFRHRRRALNAARVYVVRAEDLLLSRGSSSRRRLRLSLERCALHIDLARFHSRTGEYDKVAFFRELAHLDLRFIGKRTEKLGLARNWRRIYEQQKERYTGLLMLSEDWMAEIRTIREFVFPDDICRKTRPAIAEAYERISMRDFDFNHVRDFIGGCEATLRQRRDNRRGSTTSLRKIEDMLERCNILQKQMRGRFERT